MVAITVILAAVIAAFVFGMAGNIQKTKVVAATVVRPNSSGVIVTYQGGQDAATLVGINFTVGGAQATLQTTAPTGTTIIGPGTSSIVTNGATPAFPVGAAIYISNAPTNSHVVGVGDFSDGTTQVILDTTL
jgi:FlaG/FlaF family flagellin (archaellin)